MEAASQGAFVPVKVPPSLALLMAVTSVNGAPEAPRTAGRFPMEPETRYIVLATLPPP